MSAEGAIVASDTDPVKELVTHDETGRLVDFFDRDALVAEVCNLLDDAALRTRLGQAARKHVVSHYDLKKICLPGQLKWVHDLAALPPPHNGLALHLIRGMGNLPILPVQLPCYWLRISCR